MEALERRALMARPLLIRSGKRDARAVALPVNVGASCDMPDVQRLRALVLVLVLVLKATIGCSCEASCSVRCSRSSTCHILEVAGT